MNTHTEPLVSIIVPIYEVENYLEKCVKSITGQTLKNIEIILVDDGSPDSCGEICESLAKDDSRIVVLHKKNGGLSDARNKGIDIASAKYIAFIDSDDYIDADMIEMLYSNIIREDAEISVCGMYHHSGDIVSTTQDLIGYKVADTPEAVKLELTKAPVTAVNKIYKKSLFEKVKFPAGKLYEDAFTMIPLTLESNKVVYDLKPKYHYVHRVDSITTKPYRPQMLNLIEANQKNMQLVKKAYPEMKREAEFRYYWSHFWVLDYMLRTGCLDSEAIQKKREICRFLKKNTLAILRNPYFQKTRKLSALVLFINSRLYEKIVVMYMNRVYTNPSAIPD